MTKEDKIEILTESIIDKMTEYLIEDFQLNIPSAMNVIYNSLTLELLQNKNTDLYARSPGYVYYILKNEYQTGKMP
jgi:hypothetical protein